MLPSPYVWISIVSMKSFHPRCYPDVLHTVITTDSMRNLEYGAGVEEKIQYRISLVVVGGSYTSYKTRIAINKRVDDDTPLYQTFTQNTGNKLRSGQKQIPHTVLYIMMPERVRPRNSVWAPPDVASTKRLFTEAQSLHGVENSFQGNVQCVLLLDCCFY